jgi:hypothetical protein
LIFNDRFCSIYLEQHSYDKDYFHYGQNRLSTTDIGNSSQSTKDAPITSKLSATAASFSQATSPATTLYFNPVLYTVPPYYASHQDRTMTYPSTDNRVSNFPFKLLKKNLNSFEG